MDPDAGTMDLFQIMDPDAGTMCIYLYLHVYLYVCIYLIVAGNVVPWLKVKISPQSLGLFVNTDVGVPTAMPVRTPSCLGVVAAWLSNTARMIAREMIGNGTRRTARLANGFAPWQDTQLTDEPSFNEDSDQEITGSFYQRVLSLNQKIIYTRDGREQAKR